MASRTVTLEISEALAERLEKSGLLEDSERLEQILEEALKRSKLQATFAKFDSLPDEEKPTPEEILAEVKAYRSEKRTASEDRS
jgi:hypothetical protein